MRAVFLAYPLLLHAAIVTGQPVLMFLSLLALALGILASPLSERRPWAIGLTVVLAGGAALLTWGGAALYFLYLPPVLFHLFMMHLFASSLRAGRTPLISVVARQIRGDLPEPIAHYTRWLTGAWAVAFAAMALWSALAAWLATPELWSWITNVLNYIIVAALFVVEYIYRRWRYADVPHPDLGRYLRGLVSTDFRRTP